MTEKTLKRYTDFLDENKERFGLISYEILNDITIVYTMKKGYERNFEMLFNHRLKPEKVTGGRPVTFIEEN